MNRRTSVHRSAIFRTRNVAMAAVCSAALVAGCSSSSKGTSASSTSVPATSATTAPSSSVAGTGNQSNATLASQYVSQYFSNSISVSQLQPVTVDAFATAEKPFTAAQKSLLFSCLTKETCNTGHGQYILGIAETNDNNALRQLFRLDALAQAIATPDIKEVIYLNAGGSLSTWLSQFRTLMSLHANAILVEPDFGAPQIAVMHQATQQGIDVVMSTVLQGATPGVDYGQVVEQAGNICSLWTTIANEAIKDLGQGKTYASYTGPAGNTYYAAAHPCYSKTLNAAGWKQVTAGNTNWTPQGEQQAASALIASGKHPDAIFYDYLPDSFIQAYITAHQTPPAIFGVDGNLQLYQLYQSALASGTKLDVYISPTTESGYFYRIEVTAAVEKLQGKTVPSTITIPAVIEPLSKMVSEAGSVSAYPAQTPLPIDAPASWVVKALK